MLIFEGICEEKAFVIGIAFLTSCLAPLAAGI